MEYYAVHASNELYHHGIKGMHWYQRRFQNEDGSLTSEGRARYGVKSISSSAKSTVQKVKSKVSSAKSETHAKNVKKYTDKGYTKEAAEDKNKSIHIKKAVAAGVLTAGAAALAYKYGPTAVDAIKNLQKTRVLPKEGLRKVSKAEQYANKYAGKVAAVGVVGGLYGLHRTQKTSEKTASHDQYYQAKNNNWYGLDKATYKKFAKMNNEVTNKYKGRSLASLAVADTIGYNVGLNIVKSYVSYNGGDKASGRKRAILATAGVAADIALAVHESNNQQFYTKTKRKITKYKKAHNIE